MKCQGLLSQKTLQDFTLQILNISVQFTGITLLHLSLANSFKSSPNGDDLNEVSRMVFSENLT